MKPIKLKKLNYYSPITKNVMDKIVLTGLYTAIILLLIAMILIIKGV